MGPKPSFCITEARLQRALRTVADVIYVYGDVYWPVFEVLKAELDDRQSRRAQLAEFRERPSNANAKSTQKIAKESLSQQRTV